MKNIILIVDDVASNIDVLTGILKDSYSIMAAISGESAIRLLARKSPDLVLLDVSMPGIDGFGVLQFMKREKRLANIPVIFVTGEQAPDTEETGLSLGAVDYVKKPYNASVIKTKVRNHLELKSYRDSLEMLVHERTRELEERTRELEKRTKQLAASHEAIIMGMSLMSEIHDKVTGEHIERIKAFTKVLSEKVLELHPDTITPDMVKQITLFCPLHDVGKVGIPDNILKKSGPLSPEQFEIMKKHTLDAAKLLRKTELFFADGEDANLEVAIEIALSHHERYDGTGYPYGLKGEEIPISARIVAVADVYDALRSARSYKRAYSHAEAVDIVINGDGRTEPDHFDPKVLEAFRIVHGEFERIYESAEPLVRAV